MSTITLDFDDDVVALLREPSRPAHEGAKELITLELYRRGVISSGKAAEVLGTSRMEFIRHASRLGIPYISMSEEEWDEEVARSTRV